MKTLPINLLLNCLAAIFVLGANALPTDDIEDAPQQAQETQPCNKPNCLGTIFRLIVNIEELKENCVESTDIVLNGVFWNIKFCNGTQDDENNDANVLDLILSPLYGNNTWTCEASAVFKLIDKDEKENNTISLKLSNQMFSNTKSSYRLRSNVSWDDFMEQYVQDNEAIFEIELSTTPLKLKVPSDVEQMRSKFQVVAKNFGKVNETFSPTVDVRGIKWRIHTIALENETVSILLQSMNIDSDWLYKASASISILPFVENAAPFTYKFNHTFSHETPEGGFIMPWNDFLNPENRYVRHGKMVLIVEINVAEPQPLWKLERNIAIKSNADDDDVEVDDGKKLPCCVCKKKYGNGEILAANCGDLYCKSCHEGVAERNGYFWCKKCRERVQYVHPLYI